MNISLPDDMRQAIDARISGGKYANASDYMRDLVRRDLETDRLQQLHTAIDAGLASGPPRDFDSEALLAKIKAKHLRP